MLKFSTKCSGLTEKRDELGFIESWFKSSSKPRCNQMTIPAYFLNSIILVVVLSVSTSPAEALSRAELSHPSSSSSSEQRLVSNAHPENQKATATTDSEPESQRKAAIKIYQSLEATDASFEKTIQTSQKPVLVVFWAKWCGPCATFAQSIEGAKKEYEEKIAFIAIDVDKNMRQATKYYKNMRHATKDGVRGIPTIVILNKGEVIDTKIGALTQPQLQAFIKANL